MRLLEAEPDLGRFLNQDEHAEARALTLPVARVGRDEQELEAFLEGLHAFGALVLDGMLLQRLRVGEQETMRLIGPGDVLALEQPRTSTVVQQLARRPLADTHLAVLGHEFLLAARRWPGLIAALHVRGAEQAERISAQVAICQLPRVADRLLAMLWLLAESWGRVTPAGVTLPLVLTHEALGELIGARRPTVSLALAELMERGALVRQPTRWLLLESIPEGAPTAAPAEPPALLERDESAWLAAPPAPPAPSPGLIGSELHETVQRLREEVGRARDEIDQTLAEVRSGRERLRLRRAQRAEHELKQTPAPSSG